MAGLEPARTGVSRPGSVEVEEFLAAPDHPRGEGILTLRRIILDADPAIGEGIKRNAPSFRTTEYFATFHLRAKRGAQLLLASRRQEAAASHLFSGL